MEVYSPVQIKPYWTNHFYNVEYKPYQNRILALEKSIQSLCTANYSPQIQTLSSKTFWENLKSTGNHSVDIEELARSWIQIQPLAHLNTTQLLILLQEN